MSGPSLPQENNGAGGYHHPHHSIVRPVPVPFIGSPQELAKYTAATGGSYTPRTHPQSTGVIPQPNFLKQPTLPQQLTQVAQPAQVTQPAQVAQPAQVIQLAQVVQPPKQITKSMSAFAASAYESAGYSGEFPVQTIPSKDYIPTLLSPLESKPIDLNTFKGLKFVSVDSLQIETRKIYDEISGTFQWEMCESQTDRCINFIENECKNKRVFLVSTGSLGKELIPKIHSLQQLYAIYIFCGDVSFHRTWAKEYSKIRTVCNDDDAYLLPQLAVDVAQSNTEWGIAFLTAGKKDDARKKFEKALKNLVEYAKNPEPSMVHQVKSLIEQCQ